MNLSEVCGALQWKQIQPHPQLAVMVPDAAVRLTYAPVLKYASVDAASERLQLHILLLAGAPLCSLSWSWLFFSADECNGSGIFLSLLPNFDLAQSTDFCEMLIAYYASWRLNTNVQYY